MADTAHKLETPAADAGPTLNEEATEKLTTGAAEKSEEEKPATITDKATAATTAVKDNVFSMFGGGPKKDKVEEVEGENDRSGSAKAIAAKEGADVRSQYSSSFSIITPLIPTHRTRRSPMKSSQMFTSNPSSVSRRKSRPRPMKNSRSACSRCELSSSNSTANHASGKSGVLVMSDYSSTARTARLVS
jgi:hypothetical protein